MKLLPRDKDTQVKVPGLNCLDSWCRSPTRVWRGLFPTHMPTGRFPFSHFPTRHKHRLGPLRHCLMLTWAHRAVLPHTLRGLIRNRTRVFSCLCPFFLNLLSLRNVRERARAERMPTSATKKVYVAVLLFTALQLHTALETHPTLIFPSHATGTFTFCSIDVCTSLTSKASKWAPSGVEVDMPFVGEVLRYASALRALPCSWLYVIKVRGCYFPVRPVQQIASWVVFWVACNKHKIGCPACAIYLATKRLSFVLTTKINNTMIS